MDAISFTYATRNIFLLVTVNHSFTGGDVWGPRNTERRFWADDNWLPQGFLQTSLDFQGIKEIFPCSLEMFSCFSCYCCPALYTTRVSPLLGLNLTSSSPLSPPPTQLWPFSSHCFPQIHPVLPTSGTLHRLLPGILSQIITWLTSFLLMLKSLFQTGAPWTPST